MGRLGEYSDCVVLGLEATGVEEGDRSSRSEQRQQQQAEQADAGARDEYTGSLAVEP